MAGSLVKSRASTAINSELKDRTGVQRLDFALPEPQRANAQGSALGARVQNSFLPTEITAQQRYLAEEQWRATTQRLGEEVTRLAKNLRLTPAQLKALMGSGGEEETTR